MPRLEENKSSLKNASVDSEEDFFFEEEVEEMDCGTPRFKPQQEVTLTLAKVGEEM